MSDKIKDFIIMVITAIIFTIIMGGCMLYGTSSKVWYAGMHTEGCSGSNDCGCYEKLVKIDKERVRK